MLNTTPSTAGPAGSAAPAIGRASPPATRRIVDAPTRLAHALIGLSFAGAYLTAEGERWRALHVSLGYVLAGVLLFRLVYGLVGPRQARVQAWYRKLGAAPQWWRRAIADVRAGRLGQAPWRQGQNLLMAALIASLPLIMLPLLLSGLAPHLEWVGGGAADALSELHEALGEAGLAVVLAHVGGVIGLSLWRRQNQARPMISGRVPGPGPDLARHNHGWLAALLLAAVIGFLAWQWQAAPDGLLPTPKGGAAAAVDRGHGGRGGHDDDD